MSVYPEAEKRIKPYVSPRLTVHGDVEELTRSVSPTTGGFDNKVIQGKGWKTG